MRVALLGHVVHRNLYHNVERISDDAATSGGQLNEDRISLRPVRESRGKPVPISISESRVARLLSEEDVRLVPAVTLRCHCSQPQLPVLPSLSHSFGEPGPGTLEPHESQLCVWIRIVPAEHSRRWTWRPITMREPISQLWFGAACVRYWHLKLT